MKISILEMITRERVQNKSLRRGTGAYGIIEKISKLKQRGAGNIVRFNDVKCSKIL